MGLSWLEYRLVKGSCEHGDEPTGSVKCWECLETETTKSNIFSYVKPCRPVESHRRFGRKYCLHLQVR
jgi:hypothetical protein